LNQITNLKFPKLIGHRGVKNLCPENTLESINKAFDLGLSCVEIDVKISKDQIPILLHDDTIDRTTTGTGLASELNYSFLKKLDAGKFFYNRKTKNFIPKLIDVIDLCRKRKKNLNIELKPNKNFEEINVLKIVEITKNIKDINIFFSSFDLISFIKISELFSESKRSFLIDTFNEYSINDLLTLLKKYQANICGLNIKIITNEVIKKIKENNIIITAYSDKNISFKQAKKYFDMGVDSIFTDNPNELLKQF
tara:strand:- start:10 stop:765 length:756 start_codon:yes stop_codon:yes gene_type:complete